MLRVQDSADPGRKICSGERLADKSVRALLAAGQYYPANERFARRYANQSGGHRRRVICRWPFVLLALLAIASGPHIPKQTMTAPATKRKGVHRRKFLHRAEFYEACRKLFPYEGNGDRLALRIRRMAQTDVAAFLTYTLIAELRESLDQTLPRNHGHSWAHRVTTTLPTSTSRGSGISSPRLSMSSRTSSIASRIFARASETVFPCE